MFFSTFIRARIAQHLGSSLALVVIGHGHTNTLVWRSTCGRTLVVVSAALTVLLDCLTRGGGLRRCGGRGLDGGLLNGGLRWVGTSTSTTVHSRARDGIAVEASLVDVDEDAWVRRRVGAGEADGRRRGGARARHADLVARNVELEKVW
jgi:hypothetical protein